ncbi:MAG: hypothetical protein ACI837_002734 [Crocinitomicaceae bacterium]|jgi:hypothetical protein
MDETIKKARKCIILLDAMVDKYQFAPEISDQINERITECGM